MIDKSEKYLKSIDNTLKDILKELKLQGRKEAITQNVTIDVKDAKDVKEISEALSKIKLP